MNEQSLAEQSLTGARYLIHHLARTNPSLILEKLDRLRVYMRFASLFRDVFPNEFQEEALQPAPVDLDPNAGLLPLEEKFFALINERLFPLDADLMEEQILNDDFDTLFIHLENQGVYFDPETTIEDQIMDHLDNTPYMLMGVVMALMTDCFEVWDWLLEGPLRGLASPTPISMQTEKMTCLKFPEFQSLLKEAGLEDVYACFLMVSQGTGTTWLDFNPYDDYYGNVVAYPNSWTVEDIRTLADEWIEAKETLDASIRAQKYMEEHYERYPEIINFWNQCLFSRDEKKWSNPDETDTENEEDE